MAKLTVDPEKLKIKIITPGIYEVQFIKFNPKHNKDKDSINLSPRLEVINHPEFNGAFTLPVLSMKIENFIQDFVHACGLTMEDGEIPGDWNIPNGDMSSDPSKWTYNGPLSGRTLHVELVPGEWEGRQRNEVKRFICAVPNCAERFPLIRHSQNMIYNKPAVS